MLVLSPSKRGLTLIELLVVIAVVSILFALLLPAVMRGRDASRKAACANNLKQLAGAVQNFNSRVGSMPTYWGSMSRQGGSLYGGWLVHLLPELEQQALYDSLPTSTAVPRLTQVKDVLISPAVPASPDYYPGDWIEEPQTVTVEVQVGTRTEEITETERVQVGTRREINYIGVTIEVPIYEEREVTRTVEVPIYETVTKTVMKAKRVNSRGTPARPAEYGYRWVPTGQSDPTGIPPNFGALQANASLAVLQCLSDPSEKGPGDKVALKNPSGGTDGWSLTNYQASGHAFIKFGNPSGTGVTRGPGGRIISSVTSGPSMGGRFPRPVANQGATLRAFGHHDVLTNGVANGLQPRRFEHLLDGLSNTILFGEGMRQCDGGNSFRVAFLPTANAGDEHAFGIDLTVLDSGDGSMTSALNGSYGGYGNTLMFQMRPGVRGCNKFRLQSSHEDVLNVAMADGSVRGISATVSRREQVDPDVAGRTYGADTYHPAGLGGKAGYADGVWDMLLLPTDGSEGQVLVNTGEVGQEK